MDHCTKGCEQKIMRYGQRSVAVTLCALGATLSPLYSPEEDNLKQVPHAKGIRMLQPQIAVVSHDNSVNITFTFIPF